MLILPTLRALLELATRRFPDASEPWADTSDPDVPETCDPFDHDDCAADRMYPAEDAPVVDLEREAAGTRYERGSLKGKIKRTLYPRAALRKRRVLIAVHQTGVERPEYAKDGKSPHPRRIQCTGHRAIGPRGVRYRLHPLDVRLVAANRIDRAPWHAISIELVGNFAGVDGTESWAFPLANGRGRPSDAQLHSLGAEIASLVDEVPRAFPGAEVEAVVPHRITGRDKHGKPNRLIDPGSRTWAAAEDAARYLGLAVPAPGWALGGAPVPDSWRPETTAPKLLRG